MKLPPYSGNMAADIMDAEYEEMTRELADIERDEMLEALEIDRRIDEILERRK